MISLIITGLIANASYQEKINYGYCDESLKAISLSEIQSTPTHDKQTYFILEEPAEDVSAYSVDKNAVYFGNKVVPGADPKSFRVIYVCNVVMGIDQKGFYCGTRSIGEYPECSKIAKANSLRK